MKFAALKWFRIVGALTLSLCYTFSSVYGQELATNLDSNLEQLKVGQVVVVNLSVQPDVDASVFTVSANLVYDPSKLEYISSEVAPAWFTINEKEHHVTDTANGLIVRTGGFLGGVSGNTKFVTYKFKAKETGSTKVLLAAGEAFNDKNASVNIKSTQISLDISPADAEEPKEKVIDVNLLVKGDTAFYRQDPYTFTIYHKKEDNPQQAITKIWVLDEDRKIHFEDEKLWRTDQDTALKFVIPAGKVKKEGNFHILAMVRYEDGQELEVARKDIGILSNGKTWFTKNSGVFMPFFYSIVLVALLHHIFVEREVYFKLKKVFEKKPKKAGALRRKRKL